MDEPKARRTLRPAWLCAALMCVVLGVALPLPRYFALRDLDTRLEEHEQVAPSRGIFNWGLPGDVERGRYLTPLDEAHVRKRRSEVALRFWIHVGFGAVMCLVGVAIVAWPRLDTAVRPTRADADGDSPWGYIAPGAAIGAAAGAVLGWLPSRPLAVWIIASLSLPPDGAVWLVCWLCCGLAGAAIGGSLGYQIWRSGDAAGETP